MLRLAVDMDIYGYIQGYYAGTLLIKLTTL